MLKKMLIAVLAITASSAALAHDGWRDRDDGWRRGDGWGREKHYRHYYYARRPVYVVPAPRIVYAPPPPVVYPYYAAPGLSVRFSFPL